MSTQTLTQESKATQAQSPQTYDVVIMGAGWAGLCQARHLLLNVPNISIAIIDPRSPERSVKDMKIGESTVEIAANFMMKNLGLYEYLIENHAPKHGLSFHWPKDPNQTKTVDDYFNVWSNGLPPTESFQLNRAKFEKDILQMNCEMGATFYQGRVTDVDLATNSEIHTIHVKMEDGTIDLEANHVIDAAGRRFLLGKKTDNLIFDSEQLYNIKSGSAWFRVKNVDRSIIIGDGYDPNNVLSSHYYTTNHWFGNGHWIWMLPLGKSGHEVSIGVVHHKDIIPAQKLNTEEKFRQFLKANHTVLFDLVESGESVDFHYLPRLAHKSKVMVSQDNWYVLGDAAHMFDPFYSPGLSLTAISIESTTEAIRSVIKGEPDAKKKQDYFNQFLVINSETYNCLYQKHPKHLGNACAMSWRTYTEDMLWFGVLVPMFMGKWFLDYDFIDSYKKTVQFLFLGKYNFFGEFYSVLDKVVDRKLNIGLMDFTRNDQLLGDYGPVKSFDDYLKQTKFEPLRCNVYAGIKGTLFYLAIAYLKLRLKSFGILGICSPRCIFWVLQFMGWFMYVSIGEQIYKFKMRNIPDNTTIHNTREEFKSYNYNPELVPW